jgi:putative FmdB family regulatory protein
MGNRKRDNRAGVMKIDPIPCRHVFSYVKIISKFSGEVFFMPTYEYQCEKCGLLFEEFQSISAAPLTQCRKPGCDGTVKKLFSRGAGFIFKGSGFYSTDNRSEAYKKQAKADSGAAVSGSGDAAAVKTASAPAPSASEAPAKASSGPSEK